MSDNLKYYTDKNGVTRIKPRRTMVINGVLRGGGTVIKLESKPTQKEDV